ncbi:MAG TPA: NAD kinase [Paludibacteraceae bacterium]|nr:NAD kinase [Paludibacteraceae bacterium]HPH62519.1 NAD kinase [Paludibacteraceae bacterium]
MRVIIFGNHHRKEIAGYTIELVNSLHKRGCTDIIIEKIFAQYLQESGYDTSFASEIIEGLDFSADIAFTVGGDGTFIKSSAKIGKKEIPIIGINAGRLGFLADVHGEEMDAAVDEVTKGNYTIEDRSLLRLCTNDKSYSDFNYALNEIAVLKQDSSAMITIHAWANGKFLNSYQADGLLVATSTGSTAYSMSVGGPIIVPQCRNFIIIPVAPHSLNVRPLIVPDDWEIELQVESRNNHFLIALDGRNNVFETNTKLKIKKASFSTKAIKRESNDFFNTLRGKLMWGVDNRKYTI